MKCQPDFATQIYYVAIVLSISCSAQCVNGSWLICAPFAGYFSLEMENHDEGNFPSFRLMEVSFCATSPPPCVRACVGHWEIASYPRYRQLLGAQSRNALCFSFRANSCDAAYDDEKQFSCRGICSLSFTRHVWASTTTAFARLNFEDSL